VNAVNGIGNGTNAIVATNATVIATGANTARTLANYFSDVINVLDFGADPTGTVECSAAIQAAINSFSSSGGILNFPVGVYKISTTLTVSKPVMLVGQGSGDISSITGTPASQIVWYGGSSPMINYGGFGTLFSGGGIQYLALNGRSLATQCLVTKDVDRCVFTEIVMSNATSAAWLLTNTIGEFPTGFFICNDVRIFLRGGSTQSAVGIAIQGITSTGADGVTLCMMNKVRIEHANGAGVLIGSNNSSNRDAGDNFIWNGLYTFRANTETGYGVWFSQIRSDSACVGHSFYSPIVGGGFLFQTAGVNYGTNILFADELDLNSNTYNLISGAGCIDVACETQGGGFFGRKVIPNLHSSQVQDAMCFVRYDSTNGIVTTLNGSWSAITTNSSNYVDAGGLGSSINMITGASLNAAAALYGPPAFNCIAAVVTPMMSCLFYVLQTSNIQIRIGFFDGIGTTISNGVFVQYDSSVSPYWQLICVSSGTSTVQTLSFGPSAQIFEWQIRFDFSAACFNFRGDTYVTTPNAGTITTNIPSTLMGFGALVRTKTTATAALPIESIKVGWVDEGYPQS
jgi:hypothetical protein